MRILDVLEKTDDIRVSYHRRLEPYLLRASDYVCFVDVYRVYAEFGREDKLIAHGYGVTFEDAEREVIAQYLQHALGEYYKEDSRQGQPEDPFVKGREYEEPGKKIVVPEMEDF